MLIRCLTPILIAAFIAFDAGISQIYGGTITAIDPGGNFDLTGILRPTPNNDDFAGPGASAPNSIGAGKVFTNNEAMLHSFDVSNSGGTTEYFFAERVDNKTGVDWKDFHFEIIGAGNGLDFDTGTPANPEKTPTPTSTAFSSLNHQSDTLDWSGGLVKNGEAVFFTFSIDVPDSVSRFTLLEKPSLVPEPSGLFLLGTGLLLAIALRRGSNARSEQ